jgi:hypothetical protein
VNGDSADTKKSLAQEPYRWGVSDAQSTALNSAEVLGKQLVGKKAEFAGSDDLKGQTRKFGVVSLDGQFDIAQFDNTLKKYKGRVAAEATYPGNGSPIGDATQAQQAAPAIVTKMKAAGVTTVVLLADSAMVRAMMKVATDQDWFPEWWATGAFYQEASTFLRSYDPQQSAHLFGLSSLSPAVAPDPAGPSVTSTVDATWQWYWGTGVGTYTNTRSFWWLMGGIHAAGPNLTPKTFQQGWFSVPASGGAASGYKFGTMYGYGRNSGLPYNVYGLAGLDFAPYFFDPTVTGPSIVVATPTGKGVAFFLDASKRYKAGTWPKKSFQFFDNDGAVTIFPTAPSLDGFVIKATTGELAIKNDAPG